jgi:hypothetical protein
MSKIPKSRDPRKIVTIPQITRMTAISHSMNSMTYSIPVSGVG